MTFTPALKSVQVDTRGRLSLGSVYPASKGQEFQVSIGSRGEVLLTPTHIADTPVDQSAQRVDGRA